MGFDLIPRHSKAGDFHSNCWFWSWMLEAGVGLPVGHGKGVRPAQFVYKGRPDGCSLGYNDGARVTAKEAKQMAQMARWIADYQMTLKDIFEKESESTRESINKAQYPMNLIYNMPIGQEWVDKLREFADFAEKSGGFRVY